MTFCLALNHAPIVALHGKWSPARGSTRTDNMNTSKRCKIRARVYRISALACVLMSAAVTVRSQEASRAAAGTIEGRVVNPTNGEYLENSRVAIEGTTLETFTDNSGHYRVTGVPRAKRACACHSPGS